MDKADYVGCWRRPIIAGMPTLTFDEMEPSKPVLEHVNEALAAVDDFATSSQGTFQAIDAEYRATGAINAAGGGLERWGCVWHQQGCATGQKSNVLGGPELRDGIWWYIIDRRGLLDHAPEQLPATDTERLLLCAGRAGAGPYETETRESEPPEAGAAPAKSGPQKGSHRQLSLTQWLDVVRKIHQLIDDKVPWEQIALQYTIAAERTLKGWHSEYRRRYLSTDEEQAWWREANSPHNR